MEKCSELQKKEIDDNFTRSFKRSFERDSLLTTLGTPFESFPEKSKGNVRNSIDSVDSVDSTTDLPN